MQRFLQTTVIMLTLAACGGARRDPTVPRDMPAYYTNVVQGLSAGVSSDSVRTIMRMNGFNCGPERERVFSCERRTGRAFGVLPQWLTITLTTDGMRATNVEMKRGVRF